jgi:murein L,D-transpeptidase YafK
MTFKQHDFMTEASDLPSSRRTLLTRSAVAMASQVLPFGTARGQATTGTLNTGTVLAGSLPSSPEARLIEVYRAVAAGDKKALDLAASLVRDVPGFQLAQLVYGDLLIARTGSLANLATVRDGPPNVRAQLQNLRAEATLRLNALKEMPPPGTVPEQVIELARNVQHVVVVDAGHSRVFVFEQQSGGLLLIRSFYASIGRAGFGKQEEGDLRTPLGVYHITSRLEDHQVDELYGIGALPLNYPNEHDRRLGRTGSGIWLHGVPRETYSRSPFATEGCVALANDDMAYLMSLLQTRRTPVVIADEVKWVHPADLAAERRSFETLRAQWQAAYARGDTDTLQVLQTADFNARDSNPFRKVSVKASARHPIPEPDPQAQWRNVSVFRWTRQSEVAIVNYTAVALKQNRSTDRRQYWVREQSRWRLFFDGAV